jgi:cation transport regulator
MPYKTIEELPKGVKENIPEHAQDIYKEVFNNAWEQYASKAKRRGSATREETAHKVAWAAVEKEYKKDSKNNWIKI